MADCNYTFKTAEGEVTIKGMAEMKAFLALNGVDAIEGAGPDVMASNRAYHGTPYRGIDKFSTDKVGTGEGAQAYGWGLYFASKKEIAEHYRKTLQGGPLGSKVADAANKALGVDYDEATSSSQFIDGVRMVAGNGEDAVRAAIVKTADKMARSQWDSDKRLAERVRALASNSAVVKAVNNEAAGQLYEVDIPEDNEMLLWDKPLSEQPATVRKAIQQIGNPPTTLEKILAGMDVKGMLKWADSFDRNSSWDEAVDESTTPEQLRGWLLESYGDEDTASYLGSKGFDKDRTGQSIYRELTSKLSGRSLPDTMNRKQLNDWYEKQVGYRPDDDNGSPLPIEELRSLVQEMNDEVISSSDAPKYASEALLAAGIKGIKYLDGGSRADGDGSYNYVVFSGDDVAIERVYYSNRRQRTPTIGQNFTLPATDRTNSARIKLQDDALRMKRVIAAVKAKGGTVGEAQNFYDANTLMPGRVQATMDNFRDNVMRPLIDKAVAAEIDMDELALYAYAKHAKERNAYIASINPRMPDGGSGMKDADADQILADVAAGPKAAQYDELHRDLMAITANTRQVMLADGLISQDEFNALDGAYQNYIPLRGLENVDENTGAIRPGVGRGINVRGGETIRALGRKSRASDLIENVIRDYQRVVMRVEKNDVGKVLLDFVLSNPDPDLWGVDVERSKPSLNKATGLVQYTKTIEKGEDTIGVKVGGEQVYIKLADADLARAIRQAWKDEVSGLERVTLAVTGWWSNWMRNVLTRYNPLFAVGNIAKDALWSGTTASLAELGPKGLARYLANYGKAFMASSRQEARVSGTANRFIGNQSVDQVFQEFRNAGAITGGFYMRSLEDINTDLRNEMLLAGAKTTNIREALKNNLWNQTPGMARALKAAGVSNVTANQVASYLSASGTMRMLEFIGSASENATRFALYQAAKDLGRTPAQAALLAKDGTTNFNRKGEWGGALNHLFLFFNAAVQGTAQLARVMKSPAVQASMAGVAGVGFMLAMYGASAGGEDDDGEAYWDKIPSYVKERNLVFMLPPGEPLMDGITRVGKRGRYLLMPVQYGFNIFPNIGYVMSDVFRNSRDPKRGLTPTKASLHMASVFFGSVNPVGGAIDFGDKNSVRLAILPTILDLPYQLSEGIDTFGRPSSPEKDSRDVRPDSSRMFTSQINTVPEKIAKALNELGGGNEGKAGSVMGIETSFAPGTIKTLISGTTGGLGSFVEQVVSSILAMTSDEKDLKAAKVPFLNKFYGEVDEGANIGSAAERMRKVRDSVAEIKQQFEDGLNPKIGSEEKRMLKLAEASKNYQEAISAMRKDEIFIAKSDMPEPQKKLLNQQIRALRDKLATVVNREYLKSLEEQK